jgi:hypothetical protein
VDLFARYQALAPEHVVASAALAVGGAAPIFEPLPEVALARSPFRLH